MDGVRFSAGEGMFLYSTMSSSGAQAAGGYCGIKRPDHVADNLAPPGSEIKMSVAPFRISMCLNVPEHRHRFADSLISWTFKSWNAPCGSVLEHWTCVVFRARHCITRSGGVNEVRLLCFVVEHAKYSAVMSVDDVAVSAMSWLLFQRSPSGCVCVCLIVCERETLSTKRPMPDLGGCATKKSRLMKMYVEVIYTRTNFVIQILVS
jgi:hypothetical protein